MAGRNEASIQHARSALELFPDSFLGSLLAGWTLGGSGLLDEGAAALQRGLQSLPGNVWLLTALAAIHGRQGKIGEVERILWLDRAVEEHHVWTPAVLRIPLLCRSAIRGLASQNEDGLYC